VSPRIYNPLLLGAGPHRRGATFLEFSTLGLLFGDTFGKELRILVGSVLGSVGPPPLQSNSVTFVLKTLGSDEPLDLRGFGVRLLALALGLNLAANDELTNIVNFGETEKLANFGGSLGTKPFGMGDIGKTSDVAIALLDDDEGKDSQVGTDDASTDRLPLALTSAARAVARVALGKQQADTSRMHDALLHRETLLVITAGYLEDVAFELVADAVTRDLLTHALLHEDAEAAVIVDFDKLLRAVGRVGNVQLHDRDAVCRWAELSLVVVN